MTIPTLQTARLILRPFALEDAPAIQELAGAYEVAAGTLTMPHPYEDGMAEAWIESQQAVSGPEEGMVLAITTEEEGVIGAIGFHLERDHQRGELGYWVGVPYWNQGFVTEACAAMLDYVFDELGVNRVQAQHFTRNPASGRVMEKVGMRFEGIRRQHVRRLGEFEDLAVSGILASDREDPQLEAQELSPK